jgi:hypothetical protein
MLRRLEYILGNIKHGKAFAEKVCPKIKQGAALPPILKRVYTKRLRR